MSYHDLRFYFTAGQDYTPVIQKLYFPPYSDRQTVEVTIRDDQGLSRVEGMEEFELVLRTPINSGVDEPSKAVIVIDDRSSDCEFFPHFCLHYRHFCYRLLF